MSRRRKKNPLLTRILVISIVVHVIAIPILAKLGTFEKIRRQFATNTVTVLPPPPEEKVKEVAKKAETKKQVAKAKGPSQLNKAAQAHSNAPHPPVVASNAPAGPGSDSGPTIDREGTGAVGVPPKPGGPGTGTGIGPGSGETQPKPETQPQPKPQPQPETKAEPKPEPPKPHVPVFASAEPTYQPQPDIPDDLRAEALDKTCVVEISVAADGSAGGVKVSESTGVDELDQLAISAARKWKFRPATKDGEAVPSRVRLHVEFKVS
jgi:protein TonB